MNRIGLYTETKNTCTLCAHICNLHPNSKLTYRACDVQFFAGTCELLLLFLFLPILLQHKHTNSTGIAPRHKQKNPPPPYESARYRYTKEPSDVTEMA